MHRVLQPQLNPTLQTVVGHPRALPKRRVGILIMRTAALLVLSELACSWHSLLSFPGLSMCTRAQSPSALGAPDQ